MNFCNKLLGYDVGIDLGDDHARVWVKGKGLVLDEPAEGSRRIQMGAWKADEHEAVVGLLGKCLSVVPKSLSGPRVFFAVSGDMAEIGRTKLLHAMHESGARRVSLVESTMAAALGAGLEVTEPIGNMVVNIGSKTADAALIALAVVVHLGYVRLGKMESSLDADDGLSENSIIHCVRKSLERCPPELAADVLERGFTLTGFGVLRPGLDKMLANATGLSVHIADDPSTAIIRGLGKYIDIYDELLSIERKKQVDQDAADKERLARLERLEATSALLVPDGRDLLTWIHDVEGRITRLESICETRARKGRENDHGVI